MHNYMYRFNCNWAVANLSCNGKCKYDMQFRFEGIPLKEWILQGIAIEKFGNLCNIWSYDVIERSNT